MSNPAYFYYGYNPVNFGGFNGSTSGGGSSTSTWSRPVDWLAMPDTSSMTGSQGAFVGLLAVYTGSSNFVALLAQAQSGSTQTSYSVNWGDGSPTQSYLSNTQCNYSYSYDSLPASSYSSGSGGSNAPGGSGGYGYRQVLITVAPTGSAGTSSVLTNINLQKLNPTILNLAKPATEWLDIAVGGNNINTLTIGGTTPYLLNLQRANVVNFSSSLKNFSSMFNDCYALQSVPLFNTQNGTGFSSMFQNCYALQSVPLFNTQNGTNFSSMFYGCYSLQSVPLLNTINGTNFPSMFYNCYSLQSVPLFNTINGTNFSQMFYGCYSLQSVPLLNTINGTNFPSMFYNCYSLQSVPPLNVCGNSSSTGSGLFTTIFGGVDNALKLGALSGSRSTINYTSCSLSYQEIQRIYSYLGNTGSVACSITTSFNWGSSSLTTSDFNVITAKGWTYLP